MTRTLLIILALLSSCGSAFAGETLTGRFVACFTEQQARTYVGYLHNDEALAVNATNMLFAGSKPERKLQACAATIARVKVLRYLDEPAYSLSGVPMRIAFVRVIEHDSMRGRERPTKSIYWYVAIPAPPVSCRNCRDT